MQQQVMTACHMPENMLMRSWAKTFVFAGFAHGAMCKYLHVIVSCIASWWPWNFEKVLHTATFLLIMGFLSRFICWIFKAGKILCLLFTHPSIFWLALGLLWLCCKDNLMIKHNTQILARGIQSILDKYNTAEGCIPCKGDPKRKL